MHVLVLEGDAGILWQKRPTTVSKETYYSVKRYMHVLVLEGDAGIQCQKRPTTVSKETY
jgi:hypothetical protein